MTGKDISKVTFNLAIIYIVGGLLLAGVYSWTSPIIFVKAKAEKEEALQKMMPIRMQVAESPETEEVFKTLAPDAALVKSGGMLNATIDLYADQIKKLQKKLKKAGAAEVAVSSEFKPVKMGEWEPWHKHADIYNVASSDGQQVGYIIETFGKGYSSYINVLVAVDRDFVTKKISILNHAETPGLGDEIEIPSFKDMFRGKDEDHLVVIKGETEDKIQAITGATISTRAVTEGVRDALSLLKQKYGAGGSAEEEGGNARTPH